MAPRLLALLLALTSCGAPHGTGEPFPGVAIMGQSNAVGAADIVGLSPALAADFPSVPYAYQVMNTLPGPSIGGWGALRVRGSLHGCEITLGRDLFSAGRAPYLYKVATAAQAIQYFIDNWATTVSLLEPARKTATPGGALRFGPMVWQQGESDCTDPALASVYASKLAQIAALWRAYTGDPTSRIVVVEISHNMTASGLTEWPTVAAQQAAFVAADVNARLVPWDVSWTLQTSGTGAGIHYDSAGQQAIGSAAALQCF